MVLIIKFIRVIPRMDPMSNQPIIADSPQTYSEAGESEKVKYQSKSTSIMFPLFYSILALVVIWAMTSGGMGVSYDSERYLISANHLMHLETEQAFRMVSPTFPIFYPLAISVIQWLGSGGGTVAARIISILAFIISAAAVFRLGLLIQGKTTAHLSSISFLILAPLLYVFSYCWSETLYLPLSLLFLLMLILYDITPPGRRSKYLLASGLLAGLGCVTRYIGISMILTGFLAILFFSRTEGISKKIKEVTSFGCAACLPLLFYLVGCLVYLDRVFRENAPSKFSLFQQAGLFFLTIYRDFLTFYLTFDQSIELIFDPKIQAGLTRLLLIANILIGLCVLVGGILLIKTFFSSKSFRTRFRPQIGMLGYVVIYSFLVVGITSGVAVDLMGTRFTAPVYPLFLIAAFAMVAHLRGALVGSKLKRLWIGLSALSIGLFWTIQLTSSYNIYQSVRLGSFPDMEQPGNLNRQSVKFLQQNAGPGDIVVSNIPYKLNFIWPRPLSYLGISIQKEAGATGLAISEVPDSLSFLWPWETRSGSTFSDSSRYSRNCYPDPLNHRSVYILLCTQDFSHYSTPIETFEKLNQKRSLYSWKRVFGNDCIYRTDAWVFNSPQEKEDALKEMLVNIQTGGAHP